MIDAVLSFHMNTQTCGVTKFDRALAKRFGVPHDHVGAARKYRRPLFSVKTSEWEDWAQQIRANCNSYELFFHDTPQRNGAVIERAWRVFAANPVIAADLRAIRPDVIAAFCPSTVDGKAGRGAYRVLVFGMAHKLQLPHFQDLKQQLDVAHPDYTIELSTAVHEGSPWEKTLNESVEAMQDIFGNKLRVLGFLGDDAIAKVLREVDAVAMFFEPALRANNTSYWSAVESGKTIYTNRDAFSPQESDPPATWDGLLGLVRGGTTLRLSDTYRGQP